MAEPRDRDVNTIPTRVWVASRCTAGSWRRCSSPRTCRAAPVAQTYDEPRAVAIAGGAIVVLGAIDDRWPLDGADPARRPGRRRRRDGPARGAAGLGRAAVHARRRWC